MFRHQAQIRTENITVKVWYVNRYTTWQSEQHEWFEHSPPIWKTGTQPSMHMLQFIAVRTGIEPIATDRQSVMLAVTPTNLVICTGFEPVLSRWKRDVLAFRRTDYSGPPGNRTLHKNIANVFRQPWNMAARYCLYRRPRYKPELLLKV